MPLGLRAKAPARNSSDDPEEFRATLIEHLEELRDRIIRALVFILIGWVIGWMLEPWMYGKLNAVVQGAVLPRMPKDVKFETTFFQITQPFLLKFKLSFIIGLCVTFPFVILQLWGFVAPGLKPKERRAVSSAAPASVGFFFLGVLFCWLIVPSAFTWFTSYVEEFPNTMVMQEAGTMVFFVLKMMLAFGVAFQLPLIVYILGRIGLLSPETLIKNWRQATVTIFVVSALVTPSNDIFTMLMMAIPLSLLFVGSVYAVKFTAKKKQREDEYVEPMEPDELDEE